ncbi:hypothetical protein [Noviherbaspirillum galbum]|uniref:Uncharacterized protein n=1 Tax=Noviherbaspirillum galbum TaxID=2709383 RepID=A0A6B3SW72_9BURK|nr:hypothetical protein [Noviherbaspirillum galbum]NEX63186.1 hypothetical protein [Noviherbaspirillum galbum]
MSFSADAVVLALLVLLALTVAGIIAFAVAVKLRAGREKQNIQAIRSTILDYFRRSGVEVAVTCTRLGGEHYVAMVESEPMKRFRLSHIIEMTLREHVRKSSGLELDKIFWRFPVKQASGGQDATQAKVDQNSDDYINEGLEHYRHIPKPDVEELSWEHFEQELKKDGK